MPKVSLTNKWDEPIVIGHVQSFAYPLRWRHSRTGLVHRACRVNLMTNDETSQAIKTECELLYYNAVGATCADDEQLTCLVCLDLEPLVEIKLGPGDSLEVNMTVKVS